MTIPTIRCIRRRAAPAASIVGGQGYSIAGINEFDELIDDIYHFSEKQGLEIDTLIHEEGPAQLEINLRHGDPIELADQPCSCSSAPSARRR